MSNDIIPGVGKNFDITVIVLYYMVACYIISGMLIQGKVPSVLSIAVIAFVAIELVDFAVGVVHWALDKYWSYDHKYFGGLVITFRGHHEDVNKLLSHGVIKSNNNAFPIALLIIFVISIMDVSSEWKVFWLLFTFFGAYSASIHRVAHIDNKDLNFIIAFLQRIGFLISKEEHEKHHNGYMSHYCAITGHFNFFLDGINFWRKLENFIEKYFNVIPYHKRKQKESLNRDDCI